MLSDNTRQRHYVMFGDASRCKIVWWQRQSRMFISFVPKICDPRFTKKFIQGQRSVCYFILVSGNYYRRMQLPTKIVVLLFSFESPFLGYREFKSLRRILHYMHTLNNWSGTNYYRFRKKFSLADYIQILSQQ